MAYSSITKPGDHFNTKLYTGNGSTQSVTGVGFQPDWVWIKERDTVHEYHNLYDAIRGATKTIYSNDTSAEATQTGLTSFNSDGFSVGSYDIANKNTSGYASWNWLAGGTAPTQTYTVKVVSDGGNKYRFDDYGTSAVTLDLQEGGTYTFDGSDSSMASHPIKLSETSNGTHGGGSSYNTGVTYQLDGSSVTESAYVSGYSSASSRKLIITVAASAPTLYYYCHYHSGMGGQVNTNSTFGSSNFSGSIQANVSANTTAGFSIVKWTGISGNGTLGHGLSSAPSVVITKAISTTGAWFTYHKGIGATKYIMLQHANGEATDSTAWNSTDPTSSVFTFGSGLTASGTGYLAYCFTEKKGYSKIGSYTGNGNANGSFVYTGFKPAWLIIKRTDENSRDWFILDNKRNTENIVNNNLIANSSGKDYVSEECDFLSNGFKMRTSSGGSNSSGANIIFIAFAENPFVANDSGTAVPVTAR